MTGWQEPNYLGTLAAAFAETDNYPEAIAWLKKALEFPDYREQQGEQAEQQLQLFEQGKPFRDQVEV